MISVHDTLYCKIVRVPNFYRTVPELLHKIYSEASDEVPPGFLVALIDHREH